MKLNLKNIAVYGSYALVILIIISSFIYLKQSTSQINKKLDNIKTCIENDDWESSLELFNEFELTHKKNLECFSLFTNKNNLHEALLSIKNIYINILLRDKYICISNIETLKFHIEHILDSQTPKIKNIL